ncbi:MAG TPA: beta-ketoacyl-[acyl-carrier-protein] synthase family protein [Candidatus Polarisedimenticolia bacterium]|nr:beta-ketoacyl-[acyl-carrier-protein] synthase family protein [Candidatus Polarisedimenticolia bacterium]
MTRRAVITGIGAVTPAGAGREAFAAAQAEGRSATGPITQFDPAGLACRVAAEVKGFDPARHMQPQDLRRVSRATPMGIAAAREALADAGLDGPQAADERRALGIVIGSGAGGIEFGERQYRHYFSGEHGRISPFSISTSFVGSLSSEISITLGLCGMSHVVSTGCTSSTDAIGYAFDMVRHGRVHTVLTGGVEACITPALMTGFCRMKVVSMGFNHEPARASRPFDRDRDGFVIGEGAWILVLEERERALARGARVYAEVAGYGSTCDAWHRVALNPDAVQPARAIRLALADAGSPADQVGYVNLHGTGTRINDEVETLVIRKVFGQRAPHVPASAGKSMFGHPQGACGAMGVAQTALAMRDGIVPPTVNLDHPDEGFDLDYVAHAARRASFETAVCNCIGFGSKNSALLLRHPLAGTA